MAPPVGQYDSTKLINLGTHRWSVKPELGLSRAFGRWVVEAMAGVWLFTDNTDFFGGRTRTQDRIVATQFHLTYKFTRTMWLAADANYFTGGQTTIDGKCISEFMMFFHSARKFSADSFDRVISSPLWMPSGLQGGFLSPLGMSCQTRMTIWSQ